MPKTSSGFTLIELMITVAIVAILAAVALPAYNNHIIRSKRTAAQVQMMDIATRQQQFLLANRSYADKTTLEANGYALPSEVSAAYSYSIELTTSTLPTFTITFVPSGTQASDGTLTFTSQGLKSPAAKW